MRRNLSFFRIEWNGQRYYATCCEYGPYTELERALAEAEKLNRQRTASQKKQSRAIVIEWRSKKAQ